MHPPAQGGPDLDEYTVASTIELGLLLEMTSICTCLSSCFQSACHEQTRLDKLFLLALWLKNGPGSL